MTAGLVLASASPRRRELIARLGLPYEVAPSEASEAVSLGEAPTETALRLARQKALHVAKLRPSALVVGCDTIVSFEGAVLGKPGDEGDAKNMLRLLRGKTHEVVTGLAVVHQESGCLEDGFVVTRVTMRGYSDEEIEAYVASGQALDKAGAYGVQDEWFGPVASVDGCYCNVVGLPMLALKELLGRLGVTPRCEAIACCGYPHRFAGKACRIDSSGARGLANP